MLHLFVNRHFWTVKLEDHSEDHVQAEITLSPMTRRFRRRSANLEDSV